MTAEQEQEMHNLAQTLATLTKRPGWEAMRYAAIHQTMARLAKYCHVCDCGVTIEKP